jgi:hypothetical protein
MQVGFHEVIKKSVGIDLGKELAAWNEVSNIQHKA